MPKLVSDILVNIDAEHHKGPLTFIVSTIIKFVRFKIATKPTSSVFTKTFPIFINTLRTGDADLRF